MGPRRSKDRQRQSRGRWVLFVGLVVLALGACSDDTESDEPTVVPSVDGGDVARDVGEGSPDTEQDADTGVDIDGTDGGDAGDVGVVRRVVEQGLMGTMPAQNFVFNPTFRKGLRWSQFKVASGDRAGSLPAYREMYPSTPASAAVYRVPAKGEFTLGRVTGAVLLRNRSMEVSIWVGRPAPFDGHRVQVHLVGVSVSDPTKLSRVILEADGAGGREVGGRFWRRYTATVDGFFGHGYLMVQATLGTPLFVHAPVVTSPEPGPGAIRAPAAQKRPATALDRAAIRHARAERRRYRPDPVEHLYAPTLRTLAPIFR